VGCPPVLEEIDRWFEDDNLLSEDRPRRQTAAAAGSRPESSAARSIQAF